MAEKVEENKRVKISDRSVGSSQLFQNKTLNPTVGAGGQYTVQVETPAKSGFTRLAEGLATINPALQAVGESDMAYSDLAVQQASEMTMEEVKANTIALKDTENHLYKQNGWIDRLTRTGKASVLENPLTFSRAQRAAGTRIGAESYKESLSSKVLQAQQDFKNNRTEYDVNSIITQTQNETFEQFGIEKGSSLMSGFGSAAGKLNSEIRIRDLTIKDKIAQAYSEGDGGMGFYNALKSSSNVGEMVANLNEVSSQHGNLGVDGSKRFIQAALSKLANEDPQEARAFLKNMQSGELKGINFGGVDIGSPVFENVYDSVRSELTRIERKNESENAESEGKITKEVSNDIRNAKWEHPDGATAEELRHIGIEVPETYGDAEVIPSSDYAKIVSDSYKSKYPAMQRGIGAAAASGNQSVIGIEAGQKSQQDRLVARTFDSVVGEERGMNASVKFQLNQQMRTAKGEGLKKKIFMVQESMKGKLENIRNSFLAGDLPVGVDPLLDENDQEIPVSRWTGDQLKSGMTTAINNVLQESSDKVDSMVSDRVALAEQESKKAFNESTKDSKENSYKTQFKDYDLSDEIMAVAGISKNDQGNIIQASLGSKEAVNYALLYEDKGKVEARITNINKLIKKGSYTRVGKSMGMYNFETTIDEPFSEKEMKILDRYRVQSEKTLGYDIEDLSYYKSQGRREFPTGTSFASNDDLLTLFYRYDTDEEAQQIVEKVQEITGDKTYSKTKLDNNQTKPVKETK